MESEETVEREDERTLADVHARTALRVELGGALGVVGAERSVAEVVMTDAVVPERRAAIKGAEKVAQMVREMVVEKEVAARVEAAMETTKRAQAAAEAARVVTSWMRVEDAMDAMRVVRTARALAKAVVVRVQ
jgi:hypothetical protein